MTSPSSLVAVGLLGSWVAIVTAIAINDEFVAAADGPPWPILLAVAVPLAIFLAAYRSPPTRRVIIALDARALPAVQLWRVVGAAILFGWVAGDLHAGFAIPAGVGDIATGIAALFLLAALLNGTMTRRHLVAFTTLGVADFVVAVITGALIRPDGHEQLPWILFPTLAVPFFSIVHLVNWTQLSSLAAPAAPRRETGGRLGRRSGNLRTVESRVS